MGLRLIFLIYVVLQLFTYGYSSLSCFPQKNSSVTVETLSDFRDLKAHLLFWHIQKFGGTSFCDMVHRQYSEYRGRIVDGIMLFNPKKRYNCEIQMMSTFQMPYLFNYMFGKFEPGFLFQPDFPFTYHRLFKIHLTPSLLNDTRRHFWTSIVHVVNIRDPVNAAKSAFAYNFHDVLENTHNGTSVWNACRRAGISHPNICMQHAMAAYDRQDKTNSMFSSFQLHTIRTQVCGNFLVDHFSPHGSVAEAKQTLSRMFLITDFISRPVESKRLLECVLGWSEISDNLVHANRNPERTQRRLFSNSTLSRLTAYRQKDIEVYKYAMSLLEAHYNRHF